MASGLSSGLGSGVHKLDPGICLSTSPVIMVALQPLCRATIATEQLNAEVHPDTVCRSGQCPQSW